MISPASATASSSTTAAYPQLSQSQPDRRELYAADPLHYEVHRRTNRTSPARLSPSAELSPATPAASVAAHPLTYIKDPHLPSMSTQPPMDPAADPTSSAPALTPSSSAALTASVHPPQTIHHQYPRHQHQHRHPPHAQEQTHAQLYEESEQNVLGYEHTQQHSHPHQPTYSHSHTSAQRLEQQRQQQQQQQHHHQYQHAYQMPPPRTMLSTNPPSHHHQQQQHLQNRHSSQPQSMHPAAPPPAKPRHHYPVQHQHQQQQQQHSHPTYRHLPAAGAEPLALQHGSSRLHQATVAAQPQPQLQPQPQPHLLAAAAPPLATKSSGSNNGAGAAASTTGASHRPPPAHLSSPQHHQHQHRPYELQSPAPASRTFWNHYETGLLVQLWLEFEPQFTANKRNAGVWAQLAQRLTERSGRHRTVRECRIKWKNMWAKHRDLVNASHMSLEAKLREFPHFTDFAAIRQRSSHQQSGYNE
ncbi:hypothetical protein LPJ75_002865 [Coemansia sp. RSA 2598]|nr:hypothetical protein LPJ75_002865 [Coemansia sp. RSA 2598]